MLAAVRVSCGMATVFYVLHFFCPIYVFPFICLPSICDIMVAQHIYMVYMILRANRTPCVMANRCYGVATIRRLLKIIGLFCKRAL